jgi:hypothetical protein
MGECCGIYQQTVKRVPGYVGCVDDEAGFQHAKREKDKRDGVDAARKLQENERKKNLRVPFACNRQTRSPAGLPYSQGFQSRVVCYQNDTQYIGLKDHY